MSLLVISAAASGTDNKDEKNICNGGKDENLVIVNGSAAIMSEGKMTLKFL